MRSESMRNNREIVRELTNEVLSGIHRRDYLPNDAFDFSKEAQAMYFSKARRALSTEVAYVTMTIAQDQRDMELLKTLGQGGTE